MEVTQIKPVDTITPYEAGKILHANAETIRAGLRQSRFPFGTAIPPEEEGGNWNYIIIKSKFLEYAGIKEVNKNEKN
jgi:hypothetical protein